MSEDSLRRVLRDAARPRLSPHFSRRVIANLPARRRANWYLAGYWALAAAGSGWILARHPLELPAWAPLAAMAVLPVTLAIAAWLAPEPKKQKPLQRSGF